jgi:hypothetical protein
MGSATASIAGQAMALSGRDMPQATVPSAAARLRNVPFGWGLALATSALLVPGMWFKTVVDRAGGNVLGSVAIDFLAWILLCGLKIVVLCSVPIAMASAAKSGYRDVHAAARCACVWLGAGLTVLTTFSLLRSQVGALLNDPTTRFYPTTLARPELQRLFLESEVTSFVARWRSGAIVAEEALIILLSAAGSAALGYFLGRRRWLTSVSCGAWLLAILYGGNWAFGLVTSSFDFFLSGTLVGPLVLDVPFFFNAWDAVTPVTSVVYASMIWSSYAVARKAALLPTAASPRRTLRGAWVPSGSQQSRRRPTTSTGSCTLTDLTDVARL